MAGKVKAIQYVMILGIFAFLICLNDLYLSITSLESKKQKKMLTIAFSILIATYIAEMLLTMDSVILAFCSASLNLIGVTHYTIKLIASWLYTKRVEIVLAMHNNGGMQRRLKYLQAFIIFTYVSNIAKVIVFYKSFPNDEGGCVFDLGGFWSWLDEIMFGAVNILTIGVFSHFYINNKDTVGEKTAATMFRIIIFSAITVFGTGFAIIMNNFDPTQGLTASVIDITVDIVSLQKTYTRVS